MKGGRTRGGSYATAWGDRISTRVGVVCVCVGLEIGGGWWGYMLCNTTSSSLLHPLPHRRTHAYSHTHSHSGPFTRTQPPRPLPFCPTPCRPPVTTSVSQLPWDFKRCRFMCIIIIPAPQGVCGVQRASSLDHDYSIPVKRKSRRKASEKEAAKEAHLFICLVRKMSLGLLGFYAW